VKIVSLAKPCVFHKEVGDGKQVEKKELIIMRLFWFIFMLALASSVYAQLGARRGAKDGGFNDGYAEGGSGGLDGMLGGLVGSGDSSGTKSKGGIKAPSAKDIDVASGSSRSRAEIMAVTNQRVNGLKSIYYRYLENKSGFAGKVTLKFTIAPSGDITSINITSSTTSYPDFDNAIKDQVSHWKWKTINNGNTTVTVPFEFAE